MKYLLMTMAVVAGAAAVVLCVADKVRAQEPPGPTSPWGRFEGAVKGAFMRSEADAFGAVTDAVKDLPDIARRRFVGNVIRGLGLDDAPEIDIDTGGDPSLFIPVKAALDGFENADELLTLIRERGRAKPEPVIDDGEPAPVVEPEAERGLVAPIEPREAIEPIQPRGDGL